MSFLICGSCKMRFMYFDAATRARTDALGPLPHPDNLQTKLNDADEIEEVDEIERVDEASGKGEADEVSEIDDSASGARLTGAG